VVPDQHPAVPKKKSVAAEYGEVGGAQAQTLRKSAAIPDALRDSER